MPEGILRFDAFDHGDIAMKRLAISLMGLLWAATGHALTECNTTVLRLYTGDGGRLFIIFADGLSAYVAASDPNAKNFMAMLTTALVVDKNLKVRFSTDDVPCTNVPEARGDLIGIWMLK